MRIGLILECQPGGPDAMVYPYVAKKLCDSLQIDKPETLKDKKTLLNEAPLVAQTLLESGCNYVFIIWDRKPRWKDNLGNCHSDSETLVTGLNQLGINMDRVFLCCIDEMLESWMIADSRGFMTWIRNKTTHPLREIGDHKKVNEQSAPKNRIKNYLENNFPKWKYNDYEDNLEIVKCLYSSSPNFERAANLNPSFGYFKQRIEEICPN